MKHPKDWKEFDIAYQCENQPTTKELFENLDELGVQIMGTGELLLRTAKEELEKKEKRIKDLELQIETINKPLKKCH